MGKVLAWIGIALFAWAAWRLVVIGKRRAERARDRAGAAARREGAESPGPGSRRPDTPELMMQCALCGVHLPGSEARFAGGRVYCSDAHRDQAASGAPAERAPHDRG